MSERFQMPSELSQKIDAEAGPAPEHVDPAAAMTDWLWITEVLKPIGLTVLCVELLMPAAAQAQSPETSAVPFLQDILAAKLEEADVAQFDSLSIGEPIRGFYNATGSKIAKALQIVRDAAEKAGLLRYARIGFADTEGKVWRTLYPK